MILESSWLNRVKMYKYFRNSLTIKKLNNTLIKWMVSFLILDNGRESKNNKRMGKVSIKGLRNISRMG